MKWILWVAFTQASHGTHPLRCIPRNNSSLPGARACQLNRRRAGRTDAGSLLDAGKAFCRVSGAYMRNAWRLNECPLTCLHVHCFAFLAGPPQALELNPVVIVTEAAVPLTVRNSLENVFHTLRILCHLISTPYRTTKKASQSTTSSASSLSRRTSSAGTAHPTSTTSLTRRPLT